MSTDDLVIQLLVFIHYNSSIGCQRWNSSTHEIGKALFDWEGQYENHTRTDRGILECKILDYNEELSGAKWEIFL